MTSVTSVAPTEPLRAPLNRLPSLTGLRWMAAFLVFGFHVGTLNLIQPKGAHHNWDLVFGLGASGVSFFFILSGFVLVWSARPGDTRRAFWRRRVAKIWPNHVVTWLAAGIMIVYWGGRLTVGPTLATLFLVQTWPETPGYAYAMNSVSWTLCCEAFFYLCLPFALPLIRRMRVSWLYGIVIAVPLLIWLVGPVENLLPVDYRWWFSQLFPPIRSLEFWLGVVAGELTVRRRWRGPNLAVSSLLFLGIYVANEVVIPGQYWLSDMSIFFVLVIAAAAHSDLRGTRSLWRSPVLVWLGEVSFAFYLVHALLMENVLRALNRHGQGWSPWAAAPIIAGFLAAAILLSWLLFRFVETPMMRILGPKRRPRPAPPAPEPTTSPAAAAPTAAVPIDTVVTTVSAAAVPDQGISGPAPDGDAPAREDAESAARPA